MTHADTYTELASPDDLETCREAIRTGSRTFHAASLILPTRVREPALSL